MKTIPVTVLMLGGSLCLASADAPRTWQLRAEANRTLEVLADSKIDPISQGVGTPDLMTTRDINDGIAHLPGLSEWARDVRVGTYRGRVTLRGWVESEEEKRRIQELAARLVGESNVANELQVRGRSSRPDRARFG